MICMTKGCHRKTAARGLCKTCYHRLEKRVQRGTATWDELIASGQCTGAKSYRGLTTEIRSQTAYRALEFRERIIKTCKHCEQIPG